MAALGLMAVLAHPDDESLGVGGTLARYAADGVHVSLVTATRGQAGRFRGIAVGSPGHPGREALAVMRERELRAAAGADRFAISCSAARNAPCPAAAWCLARNSRSTSADCADGIAYRRSKTLVCVSSWFQTIRSC